MAKIRVLVVDDSAFMRKSLSILLESDPDIQVIDTARDGLQGVEKVKALRPDIVTMDIEMPRMDGLTALKTIMKECPTSVLMVSSLTTDGAEATIQAMEYGAVDFIPKELSYVNVNIVKIKEDLIKKVKEIVRQKATQLRLRRIKTLNQATQTIPKTHLQLLPVNGYKAIGLGISTGGPLSLQKVIPVLSKNLNVPMFIVQHMPPKFTKSLADRLNTMSELTVKEAENNEEIKDNHVYIAPGGYHMTLKKGYSGKNVVSITEEPFDTLHRPSVDVMLKSLVEVYGKHALGVIMTGMGRDGADSLKLLKSIGGYVLAQDEETCVVYGMPKAVVDAGTADVVAPLENIPHIINKAFVR